MDSRLRDLVWVAPEQEQAAGTWSKMERPIVSLWVS
jgi:hypothetical protein